MSAFSNIWPKRLSGQILLLITLIIAAVYLVAAFLLASFGVFSRSPLDRRAQVIAAYARMLDATPSDQREGVVRRLAAQDPKRDLRLAAQAPPDPMPLHPADVATYHELTGEELQLSLRPRPNDPSGFDLAWPLTGGSFLLARAEYSSEPRRIAGPVIGAFLLFSISAAVLLLWSARYITEPLRKMAKEAEAFSLDRPLGAPLAETGPLEVRSVTRALTHLDARIRSEVSAREHMLAAVNHDLRTPITRLRLRAEFIDDTDLRDKVLLDLERMDGMLQKSLTFLRDGYAGPRLKLVDLGALLQTVSDQFCDLGHDVSYVGPAHFEQIADVDELQRAVTNLVENSARYAKSTMIWLTAELGERVIIEVADNGPGLSDADKSRCLGAFERGETARTADGNAGFGLGLSIVSAIVKAHGGEFALADNDPAGLVARMTFAWADAGAAPA